MGQKVATIWLIFHNFARPRPDSMTFHAWKICILISINFYDLYASWHGHTLISSLLALLLRQSTSLQS